VPATDPTPDPAAPMTPPQETEPDGYTPLATRVVGLKHLGRLEGTPLLRRRVGRIAFLLLVVALPVALAIAFDRLLPDEPVQAVISEPDLPGNRPGLDVLATVRQMDTSGGELLVQLAFTPNLALTRPEGLRSTVVVQVNDIAGNGTLTFFEGSTMQPRTVKLGLSGSRAQRYPFDTYRSTLSVRATSLDSSTSIPVAVDVVAALGDFTVGATNERVEGSTQARIAMTIERQAGVVLWAVLFMALCWALAIAVASLSYLVLVRTDQVPFWLWGFITGILFALPNIRNSLPGDPPFGSAVDWGALYWAVLVIALCLLGLVAAEAVDMSRRYRAGKQPS
jgi:hypothetical protein